MSVTIVKRGTAAQNEAYTGANGEFTIDTTFKSLRVHDGAVAGGYLLASNANLTSLQSQVNTLQTNFNTLMADAPVLLDTLNELAAAIGDDANFITTVNGNIALKADKNNGQITGTAYLGGTTTSNDSLRVLTVTSAVNRVEVSGATTLNSPTINFTGTDANVTGAYGTKGNGAHIFYTGGARQAQITHTASAVNYWSLTGGTAGNVVNMNALGSDTNIGMAFWAKGAGYFNFCVSTASQFIIDGVASAVNQLRVKGATASSSPELFASGSDSSVGMIYRTKAGGFHEFKTGGGTQLVVNHVASAVNYVEIMGAATGSGSVVSVAGRGADTNVGLWLATKGASALNFATGGGVQAKVLSTASAVNYITLTGSATGNYVGIGAEGSDGNVGISLTNKGVANMSFNKGYSSATAVQYIFNNIGGLTTDTTAALWRGMHLGSQGLTVASANVFPRMALYFEHNSLTDPTSKRAYFALANTSVSHELDIVNNTGGAINFRASTAAGGDTSVRITVATNQVNYIDMGGNSTGNAPGILANGSDTNVGFNLSTKGAGNITFSSHSYAAFNFQIAATASSVNYLQVQGAATGGSVTLRSVGTDANVPINIITKGSAGVGFYTSSSNLQVWMNHVASAVNYLGLSGAATANAPILSAQGSDANIDLTLSAKGSWTVYLKNSQGNGFAASAQASAVNYMSALGTATGVRPLLIAQGADTNIGLRLATKGNEAITFEANGGLTLAVGWNTTTPVNYFQMTGSATGGRITFSAQGTDADVGITYSARGTGTHVFTSNSGTQFVVSSVASSVNYVQAEGAAAGGSPRVSVQGAGTDINLRLAGKGEGSVVLMNNGVNSASFYAQALAVNNLSFTATTAGTSPVLQVLGSDTNVAFRFRTKGNGAHVFETGASGNTQFAVNHVASAANYVGVTGNVAGSAPSLAAQGTDADVSLNIAYRGLGNVGINFATPNAALHVFQNGTVRGAIATVVSVDTATDIITTGAHGFTTGDQVRYTHTNTAMAGLQAGSLYFVRVLSTTTFTLHSTAIGAVNNTGMVTFTTAGAGTHTFASAAQVLDLQASAGNAVHLDVYTYRAASSASDWTTSATRLQYRVDATPMSFIEFNPLNNSQGLLFGTGSAGYISFATMLGLEEQVRVVRTASAVNYLSLTGGSTGNAPVINFTGSDTNIGGILNTKGNGQLFLNTGSTNQVRVDHTANAVNYLQLTGAATTGAPVIRFTGSDADVNGSYVTKGVGVHAFWTGGGKQFQVNHKASAVNYASISGSVTGSGVELASNGTDGAVGFGILTKGGAAFYIDNPGFGNAFRVLHAGATTTNANFLQVRGAAAASAPTLSVAGSDTDISISVTPKGNGLTIINNAYVLEKVFTQAAAATTTLNCNNGSYQVVTMGLSITTLAFSNVPASGSGFALTVEFVQDATGGRSITWPASVNWGGAGAPTSYSTASKTMIVTFVTRDGGTTWKAFLGGKDF